MRRTASGNNSIKYIFTLIVSLSFLSSFAQQISYKEWKEQAKTEIRLLPEYGNVRKSTGQLEADQTLITDELKQNGTHRKASENLVKVGFDYLYRGDIRTAMYRFNQAWLLDQKNENVYWGFGAIYGSFNDYKEALKQYEKGLLINPRSSNILTDKATTYMAFYQNSNNSDNLNKAIEIFNQSYKIDPSNQNTLFKLSAAYFYKKDCANAWKFYDECMKLGGQQVSQGYLEALKKQCNR
jgi:tetratricopeptide (TPR) repeat protein